jgi:hypothetical protein
MDPLGLQLLRDGAERFPGFFSPGAITELEHKLPRHAGAAGVRIFEHDALAECLKRSPMSNLVASLLGAGARAVRVILFDKTAQSNWAIGWHQDRTIAVREQMDEPGFDHWTVKSGVPHVEPPFRLIEDMLTARIHVDPVSMANSPLRIAPGSHRLGRIEESAIDGTVERCGTAACLAERGDLWLYRTAILHASDRSRSAAARRVLQVDFSSDDLPGGLEWYGIASPERARAKASS